MEGEGKEDEDEEGRERFRMLKCAFRCIPFRCYKTMGSDN